ncbi:MAG: Nif3-like dinuclear metal center hexameric protein [Flavobacteriales bacterium]|nr:Nif3-like dinuclear metal center hexameric protein [Flavobacteriales bacterium]
MPQIQHIIDALERLAPPALQEDYDNSGLLVGEPHAEVDKVLVSLDVTEEVVEEAKACGVGLIVSHHPIVFRPMKRLTGRDQVERTVMAALRAGIGLYAIHTNLDNVAHGVNAMMCRKLGLEGMKVLRPAQGTLAKIVTFAPSAHADAVRQSMFNAGGGRIGRYDECSFSHEGQGTFRAGEGASPFVGRMGEQHREEETRIEMVAERWNVGRILAAMRAAHPYEEVAHDVVLLDNAHPTAGSGGVGTFAEPVGWEDFVARVKSAFGAPVIRHTNPPKSPIRKVALCGGTGSFLLSDAMRAGADVFLSSDFKYHEFFGTEGRITIADIGHAEAEGGISQWLVDQLANLKDGFPNFAVLLSEVRTNPIHVS